MARFCLTLEYDGGAFFGWQRQARDITVQSVLENSLERLCQHPVTIMGAGRTDAGVHATGQVAHFDTSCIRPPDVFIRALNATTPTALTVLSAQAVPQSFHARYSAIYREYLFRLFNAPIAPALDRHRVWHLRKHLNIHSMRRAASMLLGIHDFSAFRAASCQSRSAVRNLSVAEVRQQGAEIQIRLGANAFLQHMVRVIVGSLVLVGQGIWSETEFFKIFTGRNRNKAAPTAPPHGLYLTEVRYSS